MATELTNMIVAQRNYQANSQMFTAGADLMDTLLKLHSRDNKPGKNAMGLSNAWKSPRPRSPPMRA